MSAGVPGDFPPAPTDLDVVLSPEWLTVALGGAVHRAAVVEVMETLATKVRFVVDRTANGTERSEALCVKGYFSEAGAQWASLGSREARFYSGLAATLPVRVPRSLYAGIDPATHHGVVVMEDLVAGGSTFLTARTPYHVDLVAATLEQLARLHARTWEDRSLREEQWLAPTFPGYVNVMPDADLDALLDGPRGTGVPREVRRAARLKGALQALGVRHSGGPRCLTHADAHAGNLFRLPDGTPGFVDWQIYQFAHWSIDVAYHIGTVLEPADRERCERELLEHYRGMLLAAGVDPPDAEAAWDDYRASLAYGYFMWAITRRVEPDIVETLNRRLGLAVAANGSLELLGA